MLLAAYARRARGLPVWPPSAEHGEAVLRVEERDPLHQSGDLFCRDPRLGGGSGHPDGWSSPWSGDSVWSHREGEPHGHLKSHALSIAGLPMSRSGLQTLRSDVVGINAVRAPCWPEAKEK
jgi:hypothetical protein